MATLDFYNNNAKAYFDSTVKLSMSDAIDEFLASIDNDGKSILDFGCGSGRDSKVFLSKGYEAIAVDGSEEMCFEAERYLGIPVRHMLFSELVDENAYDGIWACASILHLPFDKLRIVFAKMERALRKNGVIYASFRYGDKEGLRGERYFTDMDEKKVSSLVEGTRLSVIKTWKSSDARLDRVGDVWLNVLLKKN